MVHSAAIASTAAAQDQRSDSRAIDDVVVVPVIGAGTHDDHGTALSELRVAGKLARKPDRGRAADAGEPLLPGRREQPVLVVVARRIIALEAAADAALRYQQVKAGGYQYLAFRSGEAPHRHAARDGGRYTFRHPVCEIVELHLNHSIRFLDQA